MKHATLLLGIGLALFGWALASAGGAQDRAPLDRTLSCQSGRDGSDRISDSLASGAFPIEGTAIAL